MKSTILSDIDELIIESNKFGNYVFSEKERRDAIENIISLSRIIENKKNPKLELSDAVVYELFKQLYVYLAKNDKIGENVRNKFKKSKARSSTR